MWPTNQSRIANRQPFHLRGSLLLLTAAVLWSGAALADSREADQRITERFFAALTAADVEALDELYADDFQIWTSGSLPFSGTSNRPQALEGMRSIGSLFPNGLTFSIIGMTIDGERVAVEAESDGLHISGMPYHNRYHFLLIIRDGKIHALREYMDTEHAKDVLLRPAADEPSPEALSPPGQPVIQP